MYLFLVLVVLCAVVLPPPLAVGANILRTLLILMVSHTQLPWVVVYRIVLPTNVQEIYHVEDTWVI